MSQIRKYAFETEFSADGAIVREAAKRLTPEEIEAERAAAYDQGRQDAIAQAAARSAAALEALADAASAVVSRLEAESRAMREEAVRLAMAAARKISGAALDAFGQERALAAIEAAMDMLRHQPRLLVRLPPEAAEQLKPRIEELRDAHAYAGAILVRAEPGLRSGAVAVDWSDGMVLLDPEEAAQRVQALMDAALSAQGENA